MKGKQILISSLGNILEWLDFGLFLFLASNIANLFFPSENLLISQLSTFSVFAAGFLCRPIGGLVFAHFGDKYGRAKPLRFSILMMTFSTLCIGLLPTYSSIGIMAPLLFTFLRLIQGFAIGGEYSGVMTYLVESAPKNRRGLFGSFAATGANLGFFMATLSILFLEHYFTSNQMLDYGWRIPFITMGFLGALLAYFRIKLLETPVYKKLQAHQKIESAPLWKALGSSRKSLILIFGLNSMSCGFYYVFFAYMPEYLQHYLHFSAQSAFKAELYTLIAMLFLVPIMGAAGDRFGRKKMLLIGTGAMIILAWPLFYFLSLSSLILMTLTLSLATILSSIDQGNTLTSVVESCNPSIRYSSIAFSYNISSAIFGGLSPIIVIYLIEKINLAAPGYYIILTASFGFMAALALPKKNH